MTVALLVGGVVVAANVGVVLAGLLFAARRPRTVAPPAHPRERQRRAA